MAEETKQEVKTEEKTEELDLKRFLSSMRLSTELKEAVPMIQDNLQVVKEDVSEEDRFLSGMAVLLLNVDKSAGRLDKGSIYELIARIDKAVNDQINEIIHHENFIICVIMHYGVSHIYITIRIECCWIKITGSCVIGKSTIIKFG